jgi:hypothetical protein
MANVLCIGTDDAAVATRLLVVTHLSMKSGKLAIYGKSKPSARLYALTWL